MTVFIGVRVCGYSSSVS